MTISPQKLHIALAMLVLSILSSQFLTAFAQGTTAFTYQGQLRDNGTNANGTYTMIFNLYDSPSSGNLIGGPITTAATLANGLFTVNLDFGASAFNGSARYLDITVTNGGVTQELSPRVQVLPSPYALYAALAATVTNGAIKNAQLAVSAVNANNIASGQVVKSLNGLEDAVSLAAGNNVTITPSGNTLQISASGGGGGVAVTNELAAGNNVGLFTNNGIVQISSFVPNIQVFHNVTNAIFTVPTNVTRIEVEMWGAGGGGGNDSYGFSGGGGGAGGYAWNVFTVTPGSSFSVTAPWKTSAGQNGGTASFSGNGISMSASGGSAGTDSTSSGTGAGGDGGAGSASVGGMIVQGGAGDNTGDGGGVWRGGQWTLAGDSSGSGPGSGGTGGYSFGNPGPSGGNNGLVIIYY